MKKIISLNLCLIMLFALVTNTFATMRPKYTITVGTETFASDADAVGEGWSYSEKTNTLTLDGYNGSGITASGDLTVYVKSNSEITGASSDSAYSKDLCGIVVNGELILSCDGNLSVIGGESSKRGGEGIFASKLVIVSSKGANINVTGGNGSHAIKANKITIDAEGNLTAVGGANCAALYFMTSLDVAESGTSVFTAGKGAEKAITYLAGGKYTISHVLEVIFGSGSRNIIIRAKVRYGDINLDEKITAQDSVLLSQYLAGWAIITLDATQLSAADVNVDGTVNSSDAVLLAQYLAGWDVKLG